MVIARVGSRAFDRDHIGGLFHHAQQRAVACRVHADLAPLIRREEAAHHAGPDGFAGLHNRLSDLRCHAGLTLNEPQRHALRAARAHPGKALELGHERVQLLGIADPFLQARSIGENLSAVKGTAKSPPERYYGGMKVTIISIALLAVAAGHACAQENGENRPAMWVDLYKGEPVEFEDLIQDLLTADVVYLGERHRLGRHHLLQEKIVTALAKERPVLLGLEMIENRDQKEVERYNAGEISFEELADAIAWKDQWANYEDYRGVIEAARKSGGRILGLNAPREIIREIFRGGGVEQLPEESRAQLPEEMVMDDAPYRQWLEIVMKVHASVDDTMLDNILQAQIARDEAMAASLVSGLDDDPDAGANSDPNVKDKPLAVVITGSGHMNYRFGVPERVARRAPSIQDRLILMSESGDIELTEEEAAAAQEIEITHQKLRNLKRPISDYLHVTALKK